MCHCGFVILSLQQETERVREENERAMEESKRVKEENERMKREQLARAELVNRPNHTLFIILVLHRRCTSII